MDHAQGEKRGVLYMKSYITPVAWVCVCVLIEGVEVITQAKTEKQRAGQTQQASFIEMFIGLSAT